MSYQTIIEEDIDILVAGAGLGGAEVFRRSHHRTRPRPPGREPLQLLGQQLRALRALVHLGNEPQRAGGFILGVAAQSLEPAHDRADRGVLRPESIPGPCRRPAFAEKRSCATR